MHIQGCFFPKVKEYVSKNVRSLQRECRHVLRCLRSGGCHERLREIGGNTCHTHSASDISIRLFYWSANDE